MVIHNARRFEAILKERFGVRVSGLGNKARAVRDQLTPELFSDIERVATIRNLVAHEEDYVPFKSQKDRDRFNSLCAEIENRLNPSMRFTRTDNRAPNELRRVNITPGFLAHAEGSALIEMGNTRVICAASVEDKLPPHLRSQRTEGWVTAEYGMLPRSTHTRSSREVGRGRPSGRTHEIQRLIGRSMRAIADRSLLGERTITLDCDVLQADGGTRTAAITGAYVAFAIACRRLLAEKKIKKSPIISEVAAISVGIVDGTPLLDLKYDEDSRAEVDMNVVCTGDARFIEVQGTAEGSPFTREQMDQLLELAKEGIAKLVQVQRYAIEAGSRG